jgi:ribosomal protein S21
LLEVKKKDGESFESLLRRFSKKTLQSGKLLQAKKVKFYKKPKTKRKIRESAQRREKIRQARDYLKKIGKLDDLTDRNKKVKIKIKK